MLNLIVFIGDKAQVNYMDGYAVKLSLYTATVYCHQGALSQPTGLWATFACAVFGSSANHGEKQSYKNKELK